MRELTENIFIEKICGIPTFEKRFEFVERKGIGHPDTICDLIANKISIDLSQLYLNETGFVQHHNMDKSMLVAGQTENRFGGGKVVKPMKLILGDRATTVVDGKKIPVEDQIVKSAKSWLNENLRYVKEDDVDFQIEIGSSSQELQSIFKNQKSFAANDTSVVVGFAPVTPVERLVLQTEDFINSKQFKKEFPQTGEDVKVMAFRNQNNVDLTIAMAFVDRFIESEGNYFETKKMINEKINEFVGQKTNLAVQSRINCLDSEGKGIDGMYLTVLGTSADNADSGEVGRGNMVNQVISPSRPAGAEAAAGKNPLSHIGKVYNVLAFQIAKEIEEKFSEILEAYVWMYNVIGRPIEKPKAVVVQPILKEESALDRNDQNGIKEIVEKRLGNIDAFCKELMMGKFKVA